MRDRRATCGNLDYLCVPVTYLRDRRATCGHFDYLCLPVLTWEVGELHVCRFGLLVSTCACFRGRWATCAQLDYLCLPVLTWEVGELHVHSWTTCVWPVHAWCICICICTLVVQTIYLCIFSAHVEWSVWATSIFLFSNNDFTTWACTFFNFLKICRNVQKWWCSFDAVLKLHHFDALLM